MAWDPLEATAFLYYCSRGMPLKHVADFIFRKCGKTSKPRTKEEVLARLTKPLFDEKKKTWILPSVNRIIAQGLTAQNLTWEDFLAKMEFDWKERAGFEKGILDLIERTKKFHDPLVKQMLLGRAPESAFRPGTTVALAASLPGPGQSLLAPSPIPSSGFGAGYIGITGDASGFGGGYRSTPYPSTLQGPGNFAGASTGYASADFGYPSSQQAFQGLGQSAYKNTGHMSPPRWQDEPEEYDIEEYEIEQEVLDYQSKHPHTSHQPPPSTQALPKRKLQRLTEEQQDPIRKENQDKRIAKSEGLKRQKEETQQRAKAKAKSQAEQRVKARAQARQAVEEDPSASPSSDGEPEDDPANRQSRKRRRAPKDRSRSRSRSRSLSRLRRLAEQTELPEVYHTWPRQVIIEMAQRAARGDRWGDIEAHFQRQCNRFYWKWMLPDTNKWGWVEIERVKILKARERQVNQKYGW